ncbi:Rrf2 family transcriptional regulator, partial [Mesorhizobium sp. M7A.F.Ca.CA.002.10.1.1]
RWYWVRLAPIPCASRTQYQRCEDCNEARCQVRHLMLEVRQAIAEVLDQRSLAEMRDISLDDLSVGIGDLPVAVKVQA